MDLICPFVQVMINFYQAVTDLAWTPFSWLGIPAPNVASWMQPFAPWCTFT